MPGHRSANYVPGHRSVASLLKYAINEDVLFQTQGEAHGQTRRVVSKTSGRAAFAGRESPDDMCKPWTDGTMAVQVVRASSRGRSRMVSGTFTKTASAIFTNLRRNRGDCEVCPIGVVQPWRILRRAGHPLAVGRREGGAAALPAHDRAHLGAPWVDASTDRPLRVQGETLPGLGRGASRLGAPERFRGALLLAGTGAILQPQHSRHCHGPVQHGKRVAGQGRGRGCPVVDLVALGASEIPAGGQRGRVLWQPPVSARHGQS